MFGGQTEPEGPSILRLRIVVFAALAAAFGLAPAAAQAAGVTASTITSWVSSQPGTPANSPYLIYYDNPPATTLTVSGTATVSVASDRVDVDCFYGTPTAMVKLAAAVPIHSGTFTASVVSTKFQLIAGHACRLRALPATTTSEGPSFTGPQIAVSEAKAVTVASGPNAGKPFNFFLNGVTFTGSTAWSAPGTPSPNSISPYACGGPNMAAIDSSFNLLPNPALDCVGSLLKDDAGAWGGRSEVQIDGRNAYDAAGAQSLFAGATPSQNLDGFPAFSTSADWDPSTGLLSSESNESWVACDGPNAEIPSLATCPGFTPTGVALKRDITSSDDGHVVTLTDTWSSTDHAPHTLDLLYDDNIGVPTIGGARGYQFPGQSGFSAHTAGDRVGGPDAAPGSVFVRSAPDGDPTGGIGAITFSRAPTGFAFSSPNEFVEHHILQVPADGTATLTYIYSTDYPLASVTALALTAQDRLQPLAVAVTSPANGTTVTDPVVTVTGTASSGSGITSLIVDGQTVPVGSDGAWSANVPLNPGPNTIDLRATDAAGATANGQLTVVYQPPASPPVSASGAPQQRCKVPRTKGMTLPAAKRALRRAHCQVGRIKHLWSHKVRRGRVMNTSPRAGRELRAGAKIELFVSKGAKVTGARPASRAVRQPA